MKALNIAKMMIAASTVFMACSSHAFLIVSTGTSTGFPSPQPTYNVTIGSGDVGQTFTMNYAGSGDLASYVASSSYTIDSLSLNHLTLTLLLSNLTSTSLQSAITGFGFSVTPNATGVTLLNSPSIFDQVILQTTKEQIFPGGYKNIDICGASQTNCTGGSFNSGLASSTSDTIKLDIAGVFGTSPFDPLLVTLDSFPIKFQTALGSFELSGQPDGRGDSQGKVPEPATVALFGLGILGVALARRRTRQIDG